MFGKARIPPPIAIGSIYRPVYSILVGQIRAKGCGPCLCEDLRINAEGFGDLPEFVFFQVCLSRDVRSKTSFSDIAQSLAQFCVRNIATQHFNLHDQMIAIVPADRQPSSLVWIFQVNLMLESLLA